MKPHSSQEKPTIGDEISCDTCRGDSPSLVVQPCVYHEQEWFSLSHCSVHHYYGCCWLRAAGSPPSH